MQNRQEEKKPLNNEIIAPKPVSAAGTRNTLAERIFRFFAPIEDEMHRISPCPSPASSPEVTPPPSPGTPRIC
jgi:hypothetical protein